MKIGLDMGTTSLAAVRVDDTTLEVERTLTVSNAGEHGFGPNGAHEQNAAAILRAAEALIAEISGGSESVGLALTGQMHGVVAVDRDLKPMTELVTWRDQRDAEIAAREGLRPGWGGVTMARWAREGLRPFCCLPIPGYLIARRTGECVIDETFAHSWGIWSLETRDWDYEKIARLGIPVEWLPRLVSGSMLGDNQAGVFAAQHWRPGAAVVNLGTSGQLSVVGEGVGGERRPFPGGRVMRCRASLIGGRAFADLATELGVSYEELNCRAESDPRVADCVARIADDLAGDLDLTGVTSLVGVGNALRLNPALRAAVERRFGLPCFLPDIQEMAAYGAALARFGTNHEA